MKLLSIVLLLMTTVSSVAEEVRILTPHNALIIEATQGKSTQTVYYGSREAQTQHSFSFSSSSYPSYGINTAGETALSVTHADGSFATQLAFQSTSTRTEEHASVTVLHLKDTL